MNTLLLREVSPRDGLQAEPALLDVDSRVRFCLELLEAGCRFIEVGSFVRAERVPAMAGSAEVYVRVREAADLEVTVSALVPNSRGLVEARAAGVRHVALVAALSDPLARANLGRDAEASLSEALRLASECLEGGLACRLYMSASFHCPFLGEVPVAPLEQALRRAAAYPGLELVISDTTGRASPAEVRRRLRMALDIVPPERLACHFHDTWGLGLANAWEAMQLGIERLDAAAGGLGGCPYAPGAGGNLASEDLLSLARALRWSHELKPEKLAAAATRICRQLGHPPRSRSAAAWLAATSLDT
ncbi:MAG: hydroxymethylglutaryl-CoA lyase [Verrucomicrobiota bacterium]|jgi:hydroxymethylglutaryl-CoA lyase